MNSLRVAGWLLPFLALVACSDARSPGEQTDSREKQRLACQFTAGTLATDSVGPERPHGERIPIDTIVVLMQENRSYDHYLGRLHDLGQEDAEEVPANAANPDPTGGPALFPFHQQRECEVADLNHSWTGTHQSVDNGKMDGFAAANVDPSDPSGHRTMGYYTDDDLPYYYGLANSFAIGDRYFASVLGPTDPNRFYLVAGTSFGHISNDTPEGPSSFAQRTLFNLLDEAGISWKIYQSQFTFALLFAYVRNERRSNLKPIADFATDAAAGTLPEVALIDLEGDAAPNVELDEHPPSNVQVGQKFVAGLLDALMSGPQWSRSALFLTYDEHGGYFDHVPPAKACVPDEISPILEPGDDFAASFDHTGVRVPLIVVSPFARRHFVSHVVYDHTSILRFIETRFELPALTARDANADPMLDLFDFASPPLLQPPTLPSAQIDPSHFAECAR
jgi:phospholipase C